MLMEFEGRVLNQNLEHLERCKAYNEQLLLQRADRPNKHARTNVVYFEETFCIASTTY